MTMAKRIGAKHCLDHKRLQ